MNMNIDRLTKKFRDILSEAQHVAHNNRQQFVEALHLVQALINNDCLAKRNSSLFIILKLSEGGRSDISLLIVSVKLPSPLPLNKICCRSF